MSSGTVKPACSAIHSGDLPTTVGLSLAPAQLRRVGRDAEDELLQLVFSAAVGQVGVQALELGEGLVVDLGRRG